MKYLSQLKNMNWKKLPYIKIGMVLLLFAFMFLLGELIGYLSHQSNASVSVTSIVKSTADWGLGFGDDGTQPKGNATVDELKRYNAYYMGDDDEKVIYLTFDCGYENGNTDAILDALKKHNVQATFFVVGHFLESASEKVLRMVEEGHTVGNHTYHHYDMNNISDQVSFQKELEDVETKYKEIVGTDMVKYYRPPKGKYSTMNLEMADELGYQTFFWSLAYVDWDQDNQPEHDAAIAKLTKRIHPGAIVLLHNTSSTNAEILDELLTKWEEMGYTFKPLSDLSGESQEDNSNSNTNDSVNTEINNE